MTDNLKQVKLFHETAGHAVLDSNSIPSVEDRKLRLQLILEELTELSEAYGLALYFHKLSNWRALDSASKKDTHIFDKNEALDACCDLEVVVQGAYCISGFSEIAEEAFKETMNSNMSKFCTNIEEVHIAIKDKEGITHTKVGDLYVLKRESTDKILKGPNFFQPEYSKLLSK